MAGMPRRGTAYDKPAGLIRRNPFPKPVRS